jgi:hypothetical protein
MFYAFSVFKHYCCPKPKPTSTTELDEVKATPADPVAPPSTPVIAPVAVATYPDLPTLNPSLVRADDDTYSV